MAKLSKKRLRPSVANRIAQGLTELRDIVQRGEPLERHFRVDVVDIPAPPRFTSVRVKQLRQHLRITQSIFARLLGVSVELVEHWEQGIRKPQPIACRLLNEIEKDPAGFINRLTETGRAA